MLDQDFQSQQDQDTAADDGRIFLEQGAEPMAGISAWKPPKKSATFKACRRCTSARQMPIVMATANASMDNDRPIRIMDAIIMGRL